MSTDFQRELATVDHEWYEANIQRLNTERIETKRIRAKALIQLSSGGLAFSLALAAFIAGVAGTLHWISIAALVSSWFAYGFALIHAFRAMNESISVLGKCQTLLADAWKTGRDPRHVYNRFDDTFGRMGKEVQRKNKSSMNYFFVGTFLLGLFVVISIFPFWRTQNGQARTPNAAAETNAATETGPAAAANADARNTITGEAPR